MSCTIRGFWPSSFHNQKQDEGCDRNDQAGVVVSLGEYEGHEGQYGDQGGVHSCGDEGRELFLVQRAFTDLVCSS